MMMMTRFLVAVVLVATEASFLTTTTTTALVPPNAMPFRSRSRRRRSSAATTTTQSPRTGPAAASSLPYIDDSNFRDVLLAADNDDNKAVLLDACAPWCGPCKLMEPIVQEASTKWHNSVSIYKYNVESPQALQLKMELLRQDALARKLPSLILLLEGRVIAKHTGLVTADELDAFLRRHLEPAQAASSQTMPSSGGFVSLARSSGGDDYMLSSGYN